MLMILSFPVGALAYGLALRVLQAMSFPEQAQTLVFLFVPLFVAGLVMLPFMIPFFDRKAKADLAAYARLRESQPDERDGSEGPDDDDAPEAYDAPEVHDRPDTPDSERV